MSGARLTRRPRDPDGPAEMTARLCCTVGWEGPMADYTPLDEARDAMDGVAVAVAGTIDDAGPLARLKVHLEHLPKERLPRIAALALELTDLLDVSIDTYADTSSLSYVVRAHGTRELAQQRARMPALPRVGPALAPRSLPRVWVARL